MPPRGWDLDRESREQIVRRLGCSRRIWTKSQTAADGNSMDTRSTSVAVVAGTGHSSHKDGMPGRLLLLLVVVLAACINWITERRS